MKLQDTSLRKKLLSPSSWFTLERFSTREQQELKKELIAAFSEPGEIVFDPFLSKGETLLAAHQLERNGIGLHHDSTTIKEIENKLKPLEGQLHLSNYGAKQRSKQLPLFARVKDIDYIWQQYSLPGLDLVLSFLPSTQQLQKLAKENFPSEELSPAQLVAKILLQLKERIKFGSYIILLAENQRTNLGYQTLAWELPKLLQEDFQFKGEKIACINAAPLHEDLHDMLLAHKYLLIFRKLEI